MAPILELIKKNAVPVTVMRSAAKGALPLSAGEMLEVLVFLTQHPLFGQDARMTLAGWDAESAKEVLSKDTTAPDVLLYYWQPENRRPVLMPALIENPAIPDELLMELAETGSRPSVSMLLASARARNAPGVVEALLSNEYLTPLEAQELRGDGAEAKATPSSAEETLEQFEANPEAEAALQTFQQEHASEIAADEGKLFELAKEVSPAAGQGIAAAVAGTESSGDQAAGSEEEKSAEANTQTALNALEDPEMVDEFGLSEQKKLTVMQKVAKLNVGQRIKLGFIGGKEERALLIRDTARLVQNAVLSSPKLTDAEAESFAGSKNLQENVFREIARQRRFLKLYSVVRNLVNNPRCPLDVSLTLVKTLQVYDLKSLRHNKNVPDTIRKVAAKLYTEKASRGAKKD
jgi:hypothetical protein